jgi:hypothetical protein
MRKYVIISVMASLAFAGQVMAQGCSDAGVCSMGSLRGSVGSNAAYNSITISHTFGLGEAGGSLLYIQTTQLEGRLALRQAGYFDIKLPVQYVYGNLGTTVGIGDIAISYSQRFIWKPRQRLTVTVGGKVPANRSTLDEGGLPLPMQYQSSLGSYDFVFGASFVYSSWRFAIGYQHPFSRNKNGFLRSVWSGDVDAQDYFESSRLKRGDDLIFRLEKAFQSGKRTIFLGILPILRLQKDEIVRGGQAGKLEGSDELTLNLNFSYLYDLSPRKSIRFSYANPVVWRNTRADGLTRPVVVTAALELKI